MSVEPAQIAVTRMWRGFSSSESAREKPTIYEVKDGKPNLINFDLSDGVYTIPKILDTGYLVLGKKKLNFGRHGT